MNQILANAGAVTLTKTWMVDGTPTDVGDVTIDIIDGNGDVVVASGTATTNATNGVYTYSLADQANPDVVTATWTDVNTTDTRVDRLEIIGAWLFTENQARTFAAKADATSANIPLASANEYPDATIAAERTRIGDDLETWTGRSWIPRYCRADFKGSGSSFLNLAKGHPRTSDGYRLHRPGRLNDIADLLTVSIDGTAADVADFEIDDQRLIRTDGGIITPTTTAVPFNVVVEWVYGLPYPVDSVDRIALKLLVDRLVPSAFPDRALSIDTEYGTARFVQPGGPMKNVSRLPEVNEWVHSHDQRVWI